MTENGRAAIFAAVCFIGGQDGRPTIFASRGDAEFLQLVLFGRAICLNIFLAWETQYTRIVSKVD